MSKQPGFVELCLTGEASIDQIDDSVDAWHADPEGRSLHDYLGLTEEEYSLWLRAPNALPRILDARRDRVTS